MQIAGKTVVVTGASRGLGRALVVAFAKAGSVVVGLGRNADDLQETAAQVKQSVGDAQVQFIKCDVGNAESVESAIEQINALYGSIDILFNNAALYPRISFLDETPEQWSNTVGANVNGVAYCCKAVLPFMIKAGFGRIYNLGSWAHLNPIEESAAYSATKGAVHAMTAGIARDLQSLDLNIQIHEWIPGHLNTRMSKFTGIEPSQSAQWAVEMVCDDAASSKNTIFENNYEWIPPRRLKDRLFGLLGIKR